MKGKSALMAGAAAIALVFGSGSANASYSASAPAVDAQKLNDLEQRLEADESEMQSIEQREAADEAKIAGWSNPTGWWDNTSISGRMYWDITDINNANNHVKSASNGFSWDIKRFYVGIDHKFDDTFSANITTDVNYSSTLGQTFIFIKKAYLQAKVFDDMLVVRVGSADMPWIPYDEDVYGYRFIENTLIDRIKFGNSADWGVHVLGKFWNGLIAYQFSGVAGSGYKKPLRANQPDFEGRVSLNWNGLQAAIGGYTGVEGQPHGAIVLHHYNRLDALAAYSIWGFKVGGEYFASTNHGNELGGSAPTNGHGWELFGNYTPDFLPQWSLFGRYDNVRPFSQDAAHKAFHNDYFNVGINYEPIKIVDFSLVYKQDHGANGDITDQNGVIGGTGFALGNSGTYNEVGIFGQVRW